MERLTYKSRDGWICYNDNKTQTVKNACDIEATLSHKKACNIINTLLEKLCYYEDKQEQGLLIEVPCKVGDKVWLIRTSNIKPELVETEIEKVVLKKRGLYVQLSCNSFYETSCNSIGKTVFFTEAEAEEALEKMKGE
jgi:hypothetical protein